jgi:streptogramin lyase
MRKLTVVLIAAAIMSIPASAGVLRVAVGVVGSALTKSPAHNVRYVLGKAVFPVRHPKRTARGLKAGLL